MKIYKKSGRGRKQCPICKVYLHVRVSECPKCNHVFRQKKSPYKNQGPQIWNQRGKGRKQCHKCKKYYSVFLKKCPNCDAKSQKKSKQKVVTHRQIKARSFANELGLKNKRIILTPKGKCPFRLKNNEFKSVEDWANKILDFGLGQNVVYSPQAIKYWGRQFYEYHSDEYKKLCGFIDQWKDDI